MAVSTWESEPLYTAIMGVLKRKNAMVDLELFEVLKDQYPGIGFGDFNKMLMRLEINGKISVSNLPRGKRRVEITTK